MWQQNSWWFCFFSLPLPFFLNSSLLLHPPKKTKPTILPQNLTQTYEYKAFSESWPALQENSLHEKQEADLSSRESRDGAEQKGTQPGESEAQTVLASSSYLLTVSSYSTDLWAGWASALPYLFLLLWISGNLVNYYTGQSEALRPHQSPVAGKWCKLPTSHQPRSANPPLLWPVSIPSLPPTTPWPRPGPVGPQARLAASYCAAENICQGIRGILVLRKVFNEKVNACLKKKKCWVDKS